MNVSSSTLYDLLLLFCMTSCPVIILLEYSKGQIRRNLTSCGNAVIPWILWNTWQNKCMQMIRICTPCISGPFIVTYHERSWVFWRYGDVRLQKKINWNFDLQISSQSHLHHLCNPFPINAEMFCSMARIVVNCVFLWEDLTTTPKQAIWDKKRPRQKWVLVPRVPFSSNFEVVGYKGGVREARNKKSAFFRTFLKTWLTLRSLARRWPLVSHSVFSKRFYWASPG